MRLGLARAAEAFLGDEPSRITSMLDEWSRQNLAPLPWLPGPLLDALAPLGIEVPKTVAGRQVARLLVGVGGSVDALDAAVDALREDALQTPARPIEDALSGAAEQALHGAVDDAVAVLVDAYQHLGALVADGAREPAERLAEEAHRRMAAAAAPVDQLAVDLTGTRPDRLTSVLAVERPTIDLTRPYAYQPPRRRRDAGVRALVFLVLAVSAAGWMLWGVVNGTWP